jgi:large subunit ribosomal protein L21
VTVAVEEQTADRKIMVFKKRRRKRYQKTAGHRRKVTRLRVLSVTGDLAAY